MRNRYHLILITLALGSALLVGCPGGSGSLGLGSGAGAGFILQFDGVGSADAISPTEVVVSWSAATSQTAGPGSMKYRVYREFDPAAVLLDTALVHETLPGITSYVDTGLPPYTTIYYRVVAIDPAGRRSLSTAVANARTPDTYRPGSAVYSPTIEDLWKTPDGSGRTCLTCHTHDPLVPGRLDLSTYLGVMIGVGTPATPDSFVVAYDPDATWNEFRTRFLANASPHLKYIATLAFLTFEAKLRAWALEGALEDPDSTPPIFEFKEIGNAGKYWGTFDPLAVPPARGPLAFDEVYIQWFNASDPESLPFNGSINGQLEYQIYAGIDATNIDWTKPVVREVYSMDGLDEPYAIFKWPHNSIAAVVRALDASGRSNLWPLNADPSFEANSRPRRHNEAVNEREISLRRDQP